MARIQADVAVGVDPTFVLSQNVCLNKTRVSLVTATSDRFFASPDMVGLLSGPPDLIFLDGYHTFEYLLRDFMNAEAICNDRSLIVVHDCLPIDTVMTLRHVEVWKQKTVSTPFNGWWTGDVWKLLPILAKYRPDLEIVCTDCTPTGLVCISNLSPGNGVLRENYLSIVKEFRDVRAPRTSCGSSTPQSRSRPRTASSPSSTTARFSRCSSARDFADRSHLRDQQVGIVVVQREHAVIVPIVEVLRDIPQARLIEKTTYSCRPLPSS